ncbi:MAG: hypothetical protein NXI32_07595 [bacterium]|nr:hypothetical protein [bacterium]
MKFRCVKCVGATLLLIVAIFPCGCDRVASSGAMSLPVRQDLPKIRTERGITGRSALELAKGLCVILHFPPDDVPEADFTGIRSPASEEVDAEKEQMRLLPFGQATTFNCVTFALADELQLGPTDWLEPYARESTFYTDPAQIALDSHFELVAEYSVGDLDWEQLMLSSELQHGDVVCYRQTVGEQRAIVHMGRLKRAGGQLTALSKFGLGPIAETSLAYCADVFGADLISFYRPLRSSKNKHLNP